MDSSKRQTSGGSDTTDQFLNLIADPFQAEVQQSSILAALIYAFLLSTLLFLLFLFLRPRHSLVYAPRAKHADAKHAPRPLDRGVFGWVAAIRDVKEEELVDKIGLDAVLFLRFLRMLRNIFAACSIWGCAILIPVNIVGGRGVYEQWDGVATLMKFTPQYIFGEKFWAFVVCAYLFQGTVCAFLWWDYGVVLRLKRRYFESADYRRGLHSRTLLLTHIPKSSRTDASIAELVEEAKSTFTIPRTAIGRNVKDLPKLIEAHNEAVRQLEGCLAKYLKNPEKLPQKRPLCKPAKGDRSQHGGGKVDAIDYLTEKIARLEVEIKDVRESVDSRDVTSYGFASYPRIEDAHAVAYASRKKGPGGCDIYLAPKPHDLLWQNLTMSRGTRRARMFWDGLWMVLFTAAFIVPNILTSVFLSDFSHLGLVWPSFQGNLQAHPTGWGIAQGILAPGVQTLIYMGIPILFRRLYTHSGDVSKTSRERHVTARLYAFFVFNNLVVFSVFGSAWRFVATVIAAQDQGVWEAIRSAHLFSQIMTGLCNMSTFWLTWQMQKNLGAATDLSQAWPLVWSFVQRKLFSPTPRQLIELSAPQPFMYADYYNAYLQVAVVGLTFGTLQPIILPVTAFYLAIEVWFKKYMLQYVLITKTESGGRFWRLLVNRMLFSVLLGNAVIALVVGAQGVGSINSVRNGNMLYAMIPLPFLLLAFKWYCKRAFDDKLIYHSTQPFSDPEHIHPTDAQKPKRNDRIAVRFGHPALYKTLITPMVHAKSQHLLKEIYTHRSSAASTIFEAPHRRSTDRARPSTPFAYSDVFLAEMDPVDPREHAAAPRDVPRVELVAEGALDFENFKRRAEFREAFGGDGELYGKPGDASSRSGTPSTLATMSDAGFFGRGRAAEGSVSVEGESGTGRDGVEKEGGQGVEYGRGYRRTPLGEQFDEGVGGGVPGTPLDAEEVLDAGRRVRGDSRGRLLLEHGEAGEQNFSRARGYEDTSYDMYRQTG